MRRDVRRLEIGLAVSREKARALIMAGKVAVDGKPADKAGMQVSEQVEICVADDRFPLSAEAG